MKRIIPVLTAAVVFLLSFGAVAHAAAAVEPAGGSLWDLLTPVYRAFLSGQYVFAGALSLVFAVALARRYGTDRSPGSAPTRGPPRSCSRARSAARSPRPSPPALRRRG